MYQTLLVVVGKRTGQPLMATGATYIHQSLPFSLTIHSLTHLPITFSQHTPSLTDRSLPLSVTVTHWSLSLSLLTHWPITPLPLSLTSHSLPLSLLTHWSLPPSLTHHSLSHWPITPLSHWTVTLSLTSNSHSPSLTGHFLTHSLVTLSLTAGPYPENLKGGCTSFQSHDTCICIHVLHEWVIRKFSFLIQFDKTHNEFIMNNIRLYMHVVYQLKIKLAPSNLRKCFWQNNWHTSLISMTVS